MKIYNFSNGFYSPLIDKCFTQGIYKTNNYEEQNAIEVYLRSKQITPKINKNIKSHELFIECINGSVYTQLKY